MAQLILPGQLSGRLRPGLLLAEATSFVGRSAELRQITALLRSARLVTLAGPGGVGKTRICLHAAMLASDQFPDGVWLAELSGLHDTSLLYNAVAAAFKLPDQDAPSQRAALLHRLRDRKLLLILDTCEHLIDACSGLAEDVLRCAAGVSVLATSRQPLDAPGEHAFPVPPLPVETDAAELFAQRAAAVVPGFEITPENRADVIRLCRRLDGIPLAIELAAVRLRALPLPELADRLETGFGVLAVSRRGTVPRHQTLRTAIEWSHGLCTPAERRLWARLSVFAGTFDVRTVEEVCGDGGLPREEVIHALVGLVDKSVVLRSCDGEDRYRLPDTLREFGAEQLAADSRVRTADSREYGTHDRLASWSGGMAARFDDHFLGDGQADRYRALLVELPNIRAALEYTLGDERPSASDPELLARARLGTELAARLHAFWHISGLLNEGRQWLEKALRLFPAPAGESGHPPAPERVRALGASGRLATFQGDITAALTSIRESIRQAGQIGDELAAGRGYLYLSLALAFDGQHDAGLHAAETAERRLAACADRAGLICLQSQLAQLHQLAGNTEAAIRCCERGLAMLDADGQERWVTSQLALIWGFALFDAPGRDADCARAVRRALIGTHDLGDAAGISYCLEVLGWLAVRARRFERAAWLLGAADQLWQRGASRIGDPAAMEQRHADAVGATRAALGGERFTAACAQGAGLALDAAVRLALGSPEPQPAGNPAVASPNGSGETGSSETGSKTAGTLAKAAARLPALLTRREVEIAELVASGLSNREIAAQLFISKRTVDAHVEHIFAKLEISSRVQLTIVLRKRLSA